MMRTSASLLFIAGVCPLLGACATSGPRAKGTRLGRPKAGAGIEKRIRNLAATGIGKVKIARTLGIGVSLTQRVLA